MFQTTNQRVFSGQKDMGHPMALGPDLDLQQAEYTARRFRTVSQTSVVNFEMSDVKNILNSDDLWSSESMGILKISGHPVD